MYHGYNSLKETIQKEIENQKSVLNKFPDSISRPITQSCSKYLAQFTSFQLLFKSDAHHTQSNRLSVDQSVAEVSLALLANQTLGSVGQTLSVVSNAGGNVSENSTGRQLSVSLSTGSGSSAMNETGNSLDKVNIIQLDTVEQVNWTLENLMYGLTLPHEYQDTIKDCWSVYHDWLFVLLDEQKPFLPQPIRDDPITYSKKMLWHLYHLFVPRKDSQAPTKHIMMCHGVLILIESIAKDSKLLKKDLWEDFLKFFLAINDAVLAPPFNKEDFGEIMSSRIVATLFEIWLIACNRVFPSPSLWKTFQELCANWRHHVSLVIEWNRVCYALTNRMLELTWWPEMTAIFHTSKSQPSNDTNVSYDIQTIIRQMNTETVIQSWYRFLHIIGRPVDFCDHLTISKQLEIMRVNSSSSSSSSRLSKPDFENNLNTATASVAPLSSPIFQFSCVKKLPVIFLEVIRGLGRIVDAFLGQQLINQNNSLLSANSQQKPVVSTTSSSTAGSGAKLSTGTTSRSSKPPPVAEQVSSQPTSQSELKINPYKSTRTSVNSLMHLVGQWLFEAAVRYIPETNVNAGSTTKATTNDSASSQAFLTGVTRSDYILGQAEAYGILCKIFCSVKTNETIDTNYLSRFYALLVHGLKVPGNLGDYNQMMEYESGEILASILVNGHNLFKLDLAGVNVLLVPVLNALNSVFKLKYVLREHEPRADNKPKELVRTVFNIGATSVTLVELKRYCIVIFSSLLSLPSHYGPMQLNDALGLNLTFYTLRAKMLEIFLAAMTNEQDTMNLQMLFACGRLIVGEWINDEAGKSAAEMANLDKKERAWYCYNQIVPLICAPLKMNHSTLQNHSFALSIFDSLACIAARGDSLNEEDGFCKSAISWIWHYIRMQIKRRSREHTREMHSVIVAAYNCLIMLLMSKPSVLRDKSCLQTVTNCIEIGISGSSSYPDKLREDNSKDTANGTVSSVSSVSQAGPAVGGVGGGGSSATLIKSEKELKPASLRVKEAAESVLYFLMEHTSSCMILNDNQRELTRVPLDEKSLMEIGGRPPSTRFKYFAIDGSVIVAILEKPLVKTATSGVCPTVTVLMRGAFGRQVWALHLRNSPLAELDKYLNCMANGTSHMPRVKFPARIDQQMSDSPMRRRHKFNDNSATLKPGVDGFYATANGQSWNGGANVKTPPKCELSIPSLNDVASRYVKSLSKFQRIKEDQIEFEINATNRVMSENSNMSQSTKLSQNYEPLLTNRNCNDFQSARMLLSHLGYCSLDASTLNKLAGKDDLPEIVTLDSNDLNFTDQLQLLDNLPTRTFSYASIFYMRKGQTNVKDMLLNILNDNVASIECLDDGFYLFIKSLGSIMDLTAKRKLSSPNLSDEAYMRKLNKINGFENIIYWSDLCSEICFVLPNGNEANLSYALIDDSHKVKYQSVPNDIRVMIVWLEQMQDADNVTVDELLQASSAIYDLNTNPGQPPPPSQTQTQKQKEVVVLFIHPLKNKLYRIITWSNVNKKYFYTMPLIDGMVVSSRMLSTMIRQTVLNIFRRKRLEIDDYQQPHVKRKNKITEIIKKHNLKKSEPDLFTSLLMGTT